MLAQLIVSCVWIAGFAAGVYLGTHGHPLLGGFVVLVGLMADVIGGRR